MTINVLLVNLNIFVWSHFMGYGRKYYVPKFQRYLLYVNFIIGLYVKIIERIVVGIMIHHKIDFILL